MNEQLELATSMLAVVVAAVLLMGWFYLERVEMREARSAGAALTLQADAGEGLDVRQISERNPYMRSER